MRRLQLDGWVTQLDETAEGSEDREDINGSYRIILREYYESKSIADKAKRAELVLQRCSLGIFTVGCFLAGAGLLS